VIKPGSDLTRPEAGAPARFSRSRSFSAFEVGLFPWIALLPMAGIHALASTTDDVEAPPREWFGRIALVCWFVALYLTGTLAIIWKSIRLRHRSAWRQVKERRKFCARVHKRHSTTGYSRTAH